MSTHVIIIFILYLLLLLSSFQLLKDSIVVRVGGGWVTLDHFLLEHDPCRIEKTHTGKNIHMAMLHYIG